MPDLDPAVGGWLSLAREDGWRYGFSTRQMALDAFEQWDLHATRSHNLDKLPFDAATKEAQAITKEVEASMNPLVRMFVPNFSKAMTTHREALAHCRPLTLPQSFSPPEKCRNSAIPSARTCLSRRTATNSKSGATGATA